jgi:hypothetical protein
MNWLILLFVLFAFGCESLHPKSAFDYELLFQKLKL